MRQSELHVADEIGVLDVLVALGPVEDRRVVRVLLRPRGLAHVVARREELVVLVRDDPERLARERGPLVHRAAGFGEQRRARGVDDLEADGLLSDPVLPVRVDDVPCAVRLVAVVGRALEGCAQWCLFAQERVAVRVFWGADRLLGGNGVVLYDCVVGPVDFRVDAQREEVLVVVCCDLWRDFGAVRRRRLGRVHAVGVQHARQLDLELIGAVQREGVVEAVFVVGCGDDLRHDQLAVSRGDHRAVSVVGVLV